MTLKAIINTESIVFNYYIECSLEVSESVGGSVVLLYPFGLVVGAKSPPCLSVSRLIVYLSGRHIANPIFADARLYKIWTKKDIARI